MQDQIQTISDYLKDVEGIDALFLSGSYGNGMQDAYSDIDFVLVAAEGPTDRIAGLWLDALSQLGEIVLWWDRKPIPTLINAVMADWLRLDVLILKPDQLGQQAQDRLKPLFDHPDHYGRMPKTATGGPPALTLYQVQNFIRILGLLPVALGRDDAINGVTGVSHLRNALIDLMIAQTDAPHRGGALHLSRLITDVQKAELRALPPLVPERQAVIDAHLAYAVAYLPKARQMAQASGITWPEQLETAMWVRLKAALDIDRPAMLD
jgi:hypothetical protein